MCLNVLLVENLKHEYESSVDIKTLGLSMTVLLVERTETGVSVFSCYKD